MAIPVFYYGNAFALGVLSGTSTDETNPLRRIADSDRTLGYTLLDSVGPGPASGTVEVILPTASTRPYFVMARGTTLSGWTVEIESDDVGGGSATAHGSLALSGDDSFVMTLTGVVTPRRVWRANFVSVSGITTSPVLYEVMLASGLPLTRRPLAGVGRTTVQNYQRLDVPGSAPFKFRLGEDYERVIYRITETESQTSGFQSFLHENDGGQPFWFIDDLGRSYWAELVSQTVDFDDQAGVYAYAIGVQEIPLEL